MTKFSNLYFTEQNDNPMEDSYENDSFGDFYKKYKKDISVIILATRDSLTKKISATSSRLEEECKKAKLKYYMLFIETAELRHDKEKDLYTVHNKDDEKGFSIDKYNTICIVRGTQVTVKKSSRDLLSALEENAKLYLVNSRQCIEICEDKWRTTNRLIEYNLPVPRTTIINNVEGIDDAIKRIGNKYPVILKTLTGCQGIGVFFGESRRSLVSVLQTLWKGNKTTEVLVQEIIDNDYDMRIHVLGNEVIAGMKRFKIQNDFRSNYSLGGKIEKIDLDKLDEKIKKICVKATQAVGGVWCGIDVMIDKKNNKPYIIEINTSPGLEGIEKTTKLNLAEKFIQYIQNKYKWLFLNNRIVGYKEAVKISTFGNIVTKFDTGNSRYANIINADKYEINGDTVSWWNRGKNIKSKLQSWQKIETVNNPEIQKRPIIFLDMEFMDEKYKDVPFILDRRKDPKTEALLSRPMLAHMRVVVTPRKKFLVTQNPETEKNNNE